MKRKVIQICISVMLVIFLSFSEKAIYAASASVAFSSTSSEYKVGDTFIVNLTAESSAGISGFQTYVAYDPTVLELVDTGNHVTGSEGLIYISDLSGEEQVREYHMKFKALAQGDTEVYVSDNIYMYEAVSKEQMSVSKNKLKLRITEAQNVKEQENCNLAELKISQGQLVPSFDPKVTQYQADVPSDCDMLYVDAKAKLKAASVEVEGNENLKEGENTVQVTVTGKDGNKKQYTIRINKQTKQEEILKEEEAEVEEEQEEKDEETIFGKQECILKKQQGNLHLVTSMDLEIVPVPDKETIPEGYVESSIKMQGLTFTVYVPDTMGNSDFVLIYGKVGEKEARFYKFDRVGETLQRYVDGERLSTNTPVTSKQTEIPKMIWGVLVIMLCVIFALASKIVKMRKQQIEERYEEDEWDE